ncbi:hypothetical protein IWW50_000029 [Coemansia erecta]|nr:hypothetical protein GGF43_000153 [Coemansia sp. RSA 2618]KAJ2830808.1 hypothetical protein IWW50_000029 [Coemansia erecta]
MPPRRAKKSDPPPNNSTLAKFFTIHNAKPQPPKVMQPVLESLANSTEPYKPNMKPEYDVQPADMPEDTGAGSYCSSSSVGSVRMLMDTTDDAILLDSDSDSDGLVDASGLLGPPRTVPPKTEPFKAGLSNTAPPTRYSLRTSSLMRTPSKPSLNTQTPYRNSLKSLVQTSRRQKYNLSFLEQRMDCDSSSSEDDEKEASSALVESALNVLPQEDIKQVRAQLGTSREALQSSVQVSLFSKAERHNSLGRMACSNSRFTDISFSSSDPVERLCGAHLNDPRFFRSLIESSWIQAQAHCGWKLTQSVGDMLLRTMCLDRDSATAAGAFDTLQLYLDMHMSEWELRQSSLLALMEELQGTLRERAEEVEEEAAADSDNTDGSLSQGSSLSVYVEIAVPSPASISRGNAERIAYLIEVASKSLEFLSVEDSCRVLVVFIGSLLDFRSRICSVRIQQSLAAMVDRISPPSKWMLVWPACVARLGKLFLRTGLPLQLFVTDSLPISNRRCMQIRHSLSFLFLRLQTSDYIMESHTIESLTNSSVLPGQIILRIVGEMMADAGEELFRVGPNTDFVRLEAAVGLLSNVLDSVQAMRGVRDEARAICDRLSSMGQRINEGMADRIDKTLAKDAIQTLHCRVFMTTLVNTAGLSDHAGIPATLDGWLRRPHTPPALAKSKAL